MAKRKVAKRLDAATWFKRADEFEIASHVLFKGAGPLTETLGTAYVVLRAFAVEAYLKCLVELAGTEPDWDHNFLDLFQQLRRDDRVALRAIWRTEYRHKLKAWNAQPNTPIKFKKTNLDAILEECGDAFVLFRYGTEDGSYAPFVLLNFPLSLREYILSLRPDFRPSPDPLFRDPNS